MRRYLIIPVVDRDQVGGRSRLQTEILAIPKSFVLIFLYSITCNYQVGCTGSTDAIRCGCYRYLYYWTAWTSREASGNPRTESLKTPQQIDHDTLPSITLPDVS